MGVQIAVNNISKRYGDQLILDHISAEFHTGNIYCIVGEMVLEKQYFSSAYAGLFLARKEKFISRVSLYVRRIAYLEKLVQ